MSYRMKENGNYLPMQGWRVDHPSGMTTAAPLYRGDEVVALLVASGPAAIQDLAGFDAKADDIFRRLALHDDLVTLLFEARNVMVDAGIELTVMDRIDDILGRLPLKRIRVNVDIDYLGNVDSGTLRNHAQSLVSNALETVRFGTPLAAVGDVDIHGEVRP